ncbi:hypothetical protein KK010_17345 [Enterobacter mori]|uniref:hypothetical protein n=1 Tax=Enterobacter mori TaxID=539813 RepID=UPI000D651C94|nr:hypothetical protein [Enterobacter mori]MBT1871690.1 hypothetical protein [Enterobacter mori]PWG69562.1 hypothetical protein DEM28_18170 [Enterobacter mori]BBT92722.1 hypothetical protein WP8W19C02_43420 [Enterobacter cloacae]
MKSQDIVLLLKMESLRKQEKRFAGSLEKATINSVLNNNFWQDWECEAGEERLGDITPDIDLSETARSFYTVRYLEQVTGISKTQIAESMNRSFDSNLLRLERKTGLPRANLQGLLEFLIYGIKYVFPVKPAELTRGIATSFSAPVLNKKLITAGEFQLVWPDARANSKGLAVAPLYKTVPYAVRRDSRMYAMLALIDAIRMGNPREANLAADLLKTLLKE